MLEGYIVRLIVNVFKAWMGNGEFLHTHYIRHMRSQTRVLNALLESNSASPVEAYERKCCCEESEIRLKMKCLVSLVTRSE